MSVISTTLLPSVSQSLHSCTVVNLQFSEPHPLTQPLISHGAAQVSNQCLKQPTTLSSPFPHLRLTHSRKVSPCMSQLPQDPPHAPLLASSYSTSKIPSHLSHPCLWGMTAPPSSAPTPFGNCMRTSHSWVSNLLSSLAIVSRGEELHPQLQ